MTPLQVHVRSFSVSTYCDWRFGSTTMYDVTLAPSGGRGNCRGRRPLEGGGLGGGRGHFDAVRGVVGGGGDRGAPRVGGGGEGRCPRAGVSGGCEGGASWPCAGGGDVRGGGGEGEGEGRWLVP